MAVVLAPLLEGPEVGVVRVGTIGVAGLAVAADAFALDVAQVRGGRTRASPLQVDQACLDRGAPCVGRQATTGKARRDMPAPEPCAGACGRAPHRTAAALVDLLQNLRDELRLGPRAFARRAGTQAEVVVVAAIHGGDSCVPFAARRGAQGVPR